MNLLLFRLNLRRALNPGYGLLLIAIAIVVIVSRTTGTELSASAEQPSAQLMRGFLRADVIFALLIVLAPLLLIRVAGTFKRIDSYERHWLLPRQLSRSSLAISYWAGQSAGALTWILAIFILVEAAAGGAGDSLQFAGRAKLLDAHAIDQAGSLGWRTTTDERPAGSVVRFNLGIFGEYDEVERFEISSHTSPQAEAFSSASASPMMHTSLEVQVPSGGGEIYFEFRAHGATHPLTLHDTELHLFVPCDERSGTFQFLLRVALTLAATISLALCLGAWLQPPSLILLIFGGYSLIWIEEAIFSQWTFAKWLPGYDLPSSLQLLSQGRSAGAVPLETWLGMGVFVLAGLTLFRFGLGRWRKGA
ncbi:MAG: hypothetical protein ACI8X5_002268 [Planctomycetota bacterium]|jgi:hypothetical protein